MEATAAGVWVGRSSTPGATKVGTEAVRGEREQAKLTPITNNPASGMNLYQELRLMLSFYLVDLIATIPCFDSLPIFDQISIILVTQTNGRPTIHIKRQVLVSRNPFTIITASQVQMGTR
jgi:hypothetical protein